MHKPKSSRYIPLYKTEYYPGLKYHDHVYVDGSIKHCYEKHRKRTPLKYQLTPYVIAYFAGIVTNLILNS